MQYICIFFFSIFYLRNLVILAIVLGFVREGGGGGIEGSLGIRSAIIGRVFVGIGGLCEGIPFRKICVQGEVF